MEYILWLTQQLEKENMSTLKRVANGPDINVISYNSYEVNGYVFSTADSELNLTTQNSGVSMKAVGTFRSRASDTNLIDDSGTYYGIVKKILELNYYEDFKITVFYCDWVRTEDKVNGWEVDPETNVVCVNFARFKRNTNVEDEPFIHASHASQVFYCKDETRETWHIVLESQTRLNHDMDAYANPFVFSGAADEALLSTFTDGEEN